MNKIVTTLNNKYLIAIVVALFLLSVFKMFSRRG
jgi:hypothetical protein